MQEAPKKRKIDVGVVTLAAGDFIAAVETVAGEKKGEKDGRVIVVVVGPDVPPGPGRELKLARAERIIVMDEYCMGLPTESMMVAMNSGGNAVNAINTMAHLFGLLERTYSFLDANCADIGELLALKKEIGLSLGIPQEERSSLVLPH